MPAADLRTCGSPAGHSRARARLGRRLRRGAAGRPGRPATPKNWPAASRKPAGRPAGRPPSPLCGMCGLLEIGLRGLFLPIFLRTARKMHFSYRPVVAPWPAAAPTTSPAPPAAKTHHLPGSGSYVHSCCGFFFSSCCGFFFSSASYLPRCSTERVPIVSRRGGQRLRTRKMAGCAGC